MMISEHDPVKPGRARVSRERFGLVLNNAGSPWAGQSDELYELIVARGHDPGFWLAVAGREHGFGSNRDSVLWRNQTNSWTNARSVRAPARLLGGPATVIHDPVRRGPYVRYASVRDSLIDGMYRVDEPGYAYQQAGAVSIGAVIRIWTESDAGSYVAYVVARLNEWGDRQVSSAIRGLVDVRSKLETRKPGSVAAGPFASIPLERKRGAVVHYSGPPVANRANTLAVLQAEARYHVGKNWARPGEAAIYGDGLMYHVAIGDDGTKYLCRDLESVLWHCGVTSWNQSALSVHLPIGGDQRATSRQLTALQAVVDDWCAMTGTPKADVRGHRELSPTSCPGTLMADFVHPYREGAVMAAGQWFDETGFFVGGAFWEFWRERGGLPIFGYPLSGEFQEDGMTVQYFERAVFEWHPDNTAPYQVMLRRLGAEALSIAGQ
jgi:hypothetical protein